MKKIVFMKTIWSRVLTLLHKIVFVYLRFYTFSYLQPWLKML